MKLYKYKSLDNLWHILDIVHNQRLYCANWQELNDPLEGRYEIYLGDKSDSMMGTMESRIEAARNSLRVASVSADPTNFLMWSHYANGHKGVVIEVDIHASDRNLCKITYSPFSSVFSSKLQTKKDMRHLFNGKSTAWEYEEEYRIITGDKFYHLLNPVSRIFLGPMIDLEKTSLLKCAVPDTVELVPMELDRKQGRLSIQGPKNSVKRTHAPKRFN